MDVDGIGEDGFARRDVLRRRLTGGELVMAAAWQGLLLCIRKPNTRGTWDTIKAIYIPKIKCSGGKRKAVMRGEV